MTSTATARIALLVLLLSMTGAGMLSQRLAVLRATANVDDVSMVPPARLVKAMSLGYSGLAADIYWTRAVQYFGSKHREHANRFPMLAPLLDLTTTLDPHLTIAYEFGSFFLAQKPPDGAGDADAAVKLVEKGIRQNPEQWRLYYHLGFIQYMERGDARAAAGAFEEGAKIPGAYAWMKVMAAQMRQGAGDRKTAMFLWTDIYRTTEEQHIKENALLHMVALRVDEDIAHLEAMVEAYRQKHGANPKNWTDLPGLGGVPADPSGEAYRLRADGKVLVRDYRRFPFITLGLPEGVRPQDRVTPETFRPPAK